MFTSYSHVSACSEIVVHVPACAKRKVHLPKPNALWQESNTRGFALATAALTTLPKAVFYKYVENRVFIRVDLARSSGSTLEKWCSMARWDLICCGNTIDTLRRWASVKKNWVADDWNRQKANFFKGISWTCLNKFWTCWTWLNMLNMKSCSETWNHVWKHEIMFRNMLSV